MKSMKHILCRNVKNGEQCPKFECPYKHTRETTPCNYGYKCKYNPSGDCPYGHDTDKLKNGNKKNRSCRYGEKCYNKKCTYDHTSKSGNKNSTPCKFGEKCYKQGCQFGHPTAKNKFVFCSNRLSNEVMKALNHENNKDLKEYLNSSKPLKYNDFMSSIAAAWEGAFLEMLGYYNAKKLYVPLDGYSVDSSGVIKMLKVFPKNNILLENKGGLFLTNSEVANYEKKGAKEIHQILRYIVLGKE